MTTFSAEKKSVDFFIIVFIFHFPRKRPVTPIYCQIDLYKKVIYYFIITHRKKKVI